jgi:hypothetical protein
MYSPGRPARPLDASSEPGDIDLSSFSMTSSFTIRFDAGMNSTGDPWYIDDVESAAKP